MRATSKAGHLCCPFCHGYEIDRLYVATLDLDSCACAVCGAHWDEHRSTGHYAGRSSRTSVFTRQS